AASSLIGRGIRSTADEYRPTAVVRQRRRERLPRIESDLAPDRLCLRVPRVTRAEAEWHERATRPGHRGRQDEGQQHLVAVGPAKVELAAVCGIGPQNDSGDARQYGTV